MNETIHEADGNITNFMKTRRALVNLVPEWSRDVMTFYLAIVFFVGLPGNILVLLVQWKIRVRNSTDWFVTFLAISDVLSLTICVPTLTMISQGWWEVVGSDTWCKFYYFILHCTLHTANFTITFLGLDRYMTTLHTKQIFTNRKALFACLLIYVVCGLFNLPVLFLTKNNTRHECLFDGEKLKYTLYFHGFASVVTLTQFIVLTIFYSKIISQVKKMMQIKPTVLCTRTDVDKHAQETSVPAKDFNKDKHGTETPLKALNTDKYVTERSMKEFSKDKHETGISMKDFNTDKHGSGISMKNLNTDIHGTGISMKDLNIDKHGKGISMKDLNKDKTVTETSMQEFNKSKHVTEKSMKDFNKENHVTGISVKEFNKDKHLKEESMKDFNKDNHLTENSKEDFPKDKHDSENCVKTFKADKFATGIIKAFRKANVEEDTLGSFSSIVTEQFSVYKHNKQMLQDMAIQQQAFSEHTHEQREFSEAGPSSDRSSSEHIASHQSSRLSMFLSGNKVPKVLYRSSRYIQTTNVASKNRAQTTNSARKSRTLTTNPASRNQSLATNSATGKIAVDTNLASRNRAVTTNLASRNRALATTKVMCVVAAVFILFATLPAVTGAILAAMNARRYEAGRIAIFFLTRLYLVNNFTNPLLYFWLHPKFRNKVWLLFTR